MVGGATGVEGGEDGKGVSHKNSTLCDVHCMNPVHVGGQ